MKRPLHEIEAEVPAPAGLPPGRRSLLPQIRRPLERICEALSVDYDDLIQVRIDREMASVILLNRDADGNHYRDEFGKLASRQEQYVVDTSTFVGDERDI